jgi:uncharacterized protein YecE (DUF72 family)
MKFHVGTSGYSYKEWKGSFYPEKLPAKDMLKFYGENFSTVEINNTFYRLPKESVVESWASQVPDSFRFVCKARQVITHFKRLKDCEQETEYFLAVASVLGRKQGPILFQLPPNMKKDVPRLSDFLSSVHGRAQATFEFRHESWFDEETYACLRAYSCPLCISDMDESAAQEIVPTAGWGYLRLRRVEYDEQALKEWVKKVKSQGWSDAYVFFKHEDEGTGPKLAKQFIELTKE